MWPVLRDSTPADDVDRSGRLVLDRAGIPARAQASALDPTMAYVTILDGSLVPTSHHWSQWTSILAAAGYERLRTGALSPRQAEQATRAGFTAVQELALLELVLVDRPDRPRVRTHRLTSGQWRRAADIDRAAFGTQWCLDAAMLDEIRRATPHHRARVVTDSRGEPSGFLLSGRADRTGYVQRLAVAPHDQRRGLATALLADSLRWMQRADVTRVYVNTHVDNTAALELYRRHGFEVLGDRLCVFEGRVS